MGVLDSRRGLATLGERLAAEHLTARGYRILERNFRTRYGELDLVAEDRGCLVFCEVKTRLAGRAMGPFPPLLSVGRDKQRRVRAMAGQWLGGRARRAPGAGLRFDAIGITLGRDGRVLALEHLEEAF